MKHFLRLSTVIVGVFLLLPAFASAKGKKPMTAPRETTPSSTLEKAVFGGGCFWGVEDILRKLPGVKETDVGYAGGETPNPRYEDVKTGRTGHAEVVQVTFDPKVISYETLLDYFFRLHDPTTLNQQGNDIGTQYRSIILYQGDAQRVTAEAKKRAVDLSGKWKRPLTTEIRALDGFYRAEEYHQDYLVKNPGGYTCHYLR